MTPSPSPVPYHSHPFQKWLLFAAASAATLGCSDHPITRPDIPSPGSARQALSGAATYSTSIGVASTNDVNDGAIGPITAGLSIPARSRYVIKMTGTVTVSPKSDLPCGGATFPGAGTYGPRGYDKELGIRVNRTGGNDVNFYYFGGNTDVLQSDTLYTPIVMDLTMWRRGIIGAISCDAAEPVNDLRHRASGVY